MALKVFGGLTFVGGKQVRTIVAAKSQKAAAEAVGISLGEFRNYWAETGNDQELEIALPQPGIVFIEAVPRSGEFQPANS